MQVGDKVLVTSTDVDLADIDGKVAYITAVHDEPDGFYTEDKLPVYTVEAVEGEWFDVFESEVTPA